MYIEDPAFIVPDSPAAKVWRYMDVTKFAYMLDKKALYFTRSDLLDDQFEGAPTNLMWTEETADQFVQDRTANGKHTQDQVREFKAHYLGMMRNNRKNAKLQRLALYVNCWHLNELESAAMWTLYLKSDEGIAIQSTVGRLKESIVGPELVHIGVINYRDYNTQKIDHGNPFGLILSKRQSFQHERELRAVFFDYEFFSRLPNAHCDTDLAVNESGAPKGKQIAVNVERLVEQVYVSPKAPSFVREVVESMSRRYGFEFPVAPSNLAERPLW